MNLEKRISTLADEVKVGYEAIHYENIERLIRDVLEYVLEDSIVITSEEEDYTYGMKNGWNAAITKMEAKIRELGL